MRKFITFFALLISTQCLMADHLRPPNDVAVRYHVVFPDDYPMDKYTPEVIFFAVPDTARYSRANMFNTNNGIGEAYWMESGKTYKMRVYLEERGQAGTVRCIKSDEEVPGPVFYETTFTIPEGYTSDVVVKRLYVPEHIQQKLYGKSDSSVVLTEGQSSDLNEYYHFVPVYDLGEIILTAPK